MSTQPIPAANTESVLQTQPAEPKQGKPKEPQTCVVCGCEFVPMRARRRKTCSSKCKRRLQYEKDKQPTARDLHTNCIVAEIAPEDYLLYDAESGTHVFDESVRSREPIDADDYWLNSRWVGPDTVQPTRRKDTKRARIIAAAQSFLETEEQMTLRHLHYLLVSAHIIRNTKTDYQYVSETIVEARETGEIDYDAIRDGVRESITFNSWENPGEFAEAVAGAYRKDIWKTQQDAVEIWVEKDSIVGVLEDIAREYYVTVRPLSGQGSVSYLYGIAKEIAPANKNLYIYYFGDHDPGGYTIEAAARERLIHLLIDEFGWSPGDVVNKLRWRRLGFLEDDFDKYGIRPLDAKQTDTTYKRFVEKYGTDGAELEALPPQELRKRVRDAIESHLNIDEWNRLKVIEQAERDSWVSVVNQVQRMEGGTQ